MIHILQLLCPSRHTIGALAYDASKLPAASATEQLQRRFDAAVRDGKQGPHCRLCGGQTLRFEDAPTRFRTLKEGRSLIQAARMGNTAALAILGVRKIEPEQLDELERFLCEGME